MQFEADLIQAKKNMRSSMLEDLKKISSDSVRSKSEKIQNNLVNQLKTQSGLWAGFQSLKNEPQVKWEELSQKIEWCFPVINQNKLTFKKSVQTFQKSSLGFNQPCDGEEVELSLLSGVVVPGLAFDSEGHRLGRGRGYYDQTLKNYKGVVVGICFQESLVKEVPHQSHDVKCQYIITDEISVAV